MNSKGQGPAWSNSLFEDNAEFGYGMLLAQKAIRKRLKEEVETVAASEQASAEVKAACQEYLDTFTCGITNGEPFAVKPVKLIDRIYSDIANPVFYKCFVKDSKFYVKDSCISCGKCARECPTHSIRLENGRPVWGGHCTHCMACICDCPAAAIEYGKASLGKPRYHCPVEAE